MASATGTAGGRTLTAVLFAVYALLLVGMILFKLPFSLGDSDGVRALNLIPFAGSARDSSGLDTGEIIGNVLIFVPLGIYVSMLRPRWSFGRRLLLVIGTSLALEVIQFVFAIGRSDITDVLANTVGGVIGIAIYAAFALALKGRTQVVLNTLAVICTVVVLAYFVFLWSHAR
jgi:glycopeptide antibiotics resistance protein